MAQSQGAPGAARGRVVAVAGAVGAAALVVVGVWLLVARGEASAPDVHGASATATPTGAATPEDPPLTEPGPAATAPGSDEPFVPRSEAAVPFDQPADFTTGVTARLVSVESVAGEASGPGEVAGPALRVTIELENSSRDPASVSTTVVNVYSGQDAAPASPLSGPGVQEFAGEVAAGRAARGVYVFAVPADRRDLVQVTVNYDPNAPTVMFEGAAPAGG